MAIAVLERATKCDARLFRALGQALGLIDRAHERTFAFALNDFGEVELPTATPATPDDQALLRALSTLYLASQLELAGLVPAVETLSGVAISGGVQGDLGEAATPIAEFWKARNQRFHENERRAFYTRLFGTETVLAAPAGTPHSNRGFDDAMISLCESLYKLDEQSSYGHSSAPARMRAAALRVAENLLHRGTGVDVFAAQEIVATIQQCIQILQQPSLQRAFHERSVWGTVRGILRRYNQTEPDADNYVRRGKSGMMVLSWIAGALPDLAGSSPVAVDLDHPVIASAEEWLESSLAVREDSVPRPVGA
jgi:hypothetical protein